MRPDLGARPGLNVAAVIEAADKKVLACAIDGPGWARSARDEAGALAALAAYAPRYAVVAQHAGVEFPAIAGIEVDERLAGSAREIEDRSE